MEGRHCSLVVVIVVEFDCGVDGPAPDADALSEVFVHSYRVVLVKS